MQESDISAFHKCVLKYGIAVYVVVEKAFR